MGVRKCSIFVTYISLEILYASSPTVFAKNDLDAAVVHRCKWTHGLDVLCLAEAMPPNFGGVVS